MKESVKTTAEKKVKIKKHKPKTKKKLIALCSDESISLSNIDTSLITDMSELFDDIEREDFSGIETWDTSSVTNMCRMFRGCKNFNEPLNFDTKNVTDMSSMFSNCENFNQPLNFDTSNVTDMGYMFYGCKNFNQSLNFDTKNVTSMSSMFDGCSNFNQPLNFDISKVTSMREMFRSCKNFNQPLEFDISNIDSVNEMLEGCDSLSAENVVKLGRDFHIKNSFKANFIIELIKKNDWIKKVNGKYQPQDKDELKALVYHDGIGLDEIDMSLITDMSSLFSYSKREDFSGINTWDTSNITNMSYMFVGCKNFNELLSFNTSNVTDMSGMFRGCSNFNQPLNFNTSNVTNMEYMFEGCKKFNQTLSFDTSNVARMLGMFANCYSFNQNLNFDVSKVSNAENMFLNCHNLEQKPDIDIDSIRFKKDMFKACCAFGSAERIANGEKKYKPATKEELRELCINENINLADIDVSLIDDMSSLFSNSEREDFSGINTWDTSNVTDMNNMFNSCKYLNEPLSFDTSNVTEMRFMFSYCKNFNQALNFNTSNVTDMYAMFEDCSSFNQTLNFDTKNVTNMCSMFKGCSSLTYKPDFDMGKVVYKDNMFKDCEKLDDSNNINKSNAKPANSSSNNALKGLLEDIKDYLTDESSVIGVAVLNSNDVDESDLELDGDMEISDFVWDYSCVGGFELDDDSIELNDEEHIQLALYEKTYSSGEYVVGYTREKAYAGVYKVPEINNFNPDLLVGYAYSFPDELDIPANYILKGFVYLDEDIFKNYCKGIDEKVIKEVLDECNLKSLEGIDEKARAYIFIRLFEKTGIEPNSDIIDYTTEDIIDTSIQTVNI